MFIQYVNENWRNITAPEVDKLSKHPPAPLSPSLLLTPLHKTVVYSVLYILLDKEPTEIILVTNTNDLAAV